MDIALIDCHLTQITSLYSVSEHTHTHIQPPFHCVDNLDTALKPLAFNYWEESTYIRLARIFSPLKHSQLVKTTQPASSLMRITFQLHTHSTCTDSSQSEDPNGFWRLPD